MALVKEKKSHIWERDPNDHYIEPQWVWERFFELENFQGAILDPSCGIGNCVIPARAAGYEVRAHDLIARVPLVEKAEDFLLTDDADRVDNICSNPPFKLCNDDPFPWVAKALKRVRRKAALVLPSNWVFGEERSYHLELMGLYRLYLVTPKPSMPPGAVVMAGIKPNSGTTDYVIAVFLKGYVGPWTGHWIRKNRRSHYEKRGSVFARA